MATRRLLGGLALGLAIGSSLAAEPPTVAVIGTPPQPEWRKLSVQQKSILAPLSQDWDSLENIRRKKWLGIAERYPSMKPDEQQRMQDRMREWANLSPKERAQVRGTYKDFQQLPADQKHAVKQKWEAYANLPPEERQRVRETGKSSKLLPPSATQGDTTGTVAAPTSSPTTAR